MKTKLLLLLVSVALGSTISAATITVTSNDSIGTGSLKEAVAAATVGDLIVFEFEAPNNDILLNNEIAMKSISMNGINTLNGARVVLKQTTVGKKVFDLAAGITANVSNLIFDGSAGSTYPNITAALGSTINIDNCIFRDINAGSNNGAAVRIQGAANITNCLFQNNTCVGSYGGPALCIYNGANVVIDKCSFVGNKAGLNSNGGGGAVVARGTAVDPCNVKITNSSFVNNISEKNGGALLASVQSSTNYTVNLTAVNCTFTGNQGNGAISALTTVKGKANVYLVNSIVVNNVDAASSAYSDLLETKGTDAAATAIIEPHNVIYSVASASIVTTDRNCIQVADPSTATIFNALETFATDKKRPVLSTSNGQTVAMISSTSIAKAAGVATLSPYTIPTVDQLSETRPATPAIGAVEFKDLGAGFSNLKNENKIQLISKGREISFLGLSENSEVRIYGLTGNLLLKSVVRNNQTIPLKNIRENLVLLKIGSQRFKLLLK